MKNFFKKNWLVILLVSIGLTLFLLGTLLAILSPIGLLIMGIAFLICALQYRKNNKEQDDEIEDDYIDARQYGYDEEIYYVGATPQNKRKQKTAFNKFSNTFPIVIWGILSASCIFLAISTFIKMVL